MALKTYKPTSPGQRGLVLVDKSHLSSERPIKSLTEGLTGTGGRNNKGRMTARRRGGGHKRLYRKIDFKRNKIDISATVERLEYDPNRSAFIALIEYLDGEKRYIVAQSGIKVGQKISSGDNASPEIGNALPLSKIPLGTVISCIELNPGAGAIIARSAGAFAQLMACLLYTSDAADE